MNSEAPLAPLLLLFMALAITALVVFIRIVGLPHFATAAVRRREYRHRLWELRAKWRLSRSATTDVQRLFELDEKFYRDTSEATVNETIVASRKRILVEGLLLTGILAALVLAGIGTVHSTNSETAAAATRTTAAANELNSWAEDTYGVDHGTDLTSFTRPGLADYEVLDCDLVDRCTIGTVSRDGQLLDVTLKQIGDQYVLAERGADAGLLSPELPRRG